MSSITIHYDIVERLVETEPLDGEYCDCLYCFDTGDVGSQGWIHADDCPWNQLRKLLNCDRLKRIAKLDHSVCDRCFNLNDG